MYETWVDETFVLNDSLVVFLAAGRFPAVVEVAESLLDGFRAVAFDAGWAFVEDEFVLVVSGSAVVPTYEGERSVGVEYEASLAASAVSDAVPMDGEP